LVFQIHGVTTPSLVTVQFGLQHTGEELKDYQRKVMVREGSYQWRSITVTLEKAKEPLINNGKVDEGGCKGIERKQDRKCNQRETTDRKKNSS
jgi:hypothetical protein